MELFSISTSCLENRQETALNLAADWLFYRTCRSANCSRTPATDFQEVDDDENCSTGPETVVFIYCEPSVEAVLGDFLKQQLTPKKSSHSPQLQCDLYGAVWVPALRDTSVTCILKRFSSVKCQLRGCGVEFPPCN